MSNDMQFKVALKRLEEIIDKLEEDIDDLDELVKLFEEGSELVSICDKKLTEVESRIEIITKKLNERSQSSNRGRNEE